MSNLKAVGRSVGQRVERRGLSCCKALQGKISGVVNGKFS